MQLPELKDLTPEQRLEVSKILDKALTHQFWLSVKFILGLFSANFLAMLLGFYMLKDADPGYQLGFQVVSAAANVVFMVRYFHRQIKASDAIVASKIKEVLKK
jgi:hypothetical protein